MPERVNHIILKDPMTRTTLGHPILDYSELLELYGLEYKPSEYYWRVGEIAKVQGWIIHLSVIKPQLEGLIRLLLPNLISEKLVFKIPKDSTTASFLLGSELGSINLGKLISIYPKSDNEAVDLAKRLINLTKQFRGPAILTDIHLGSIVYTRYGAFTPILTTDPTGQPVKCIYDFKGKLVADSYSIPFLLPQNILWPFFDICSSVVTKQTKLLNYAYYPIEVLKPDVKGDVIKALYFKHFWKIKFCLIKQGRKCMASDEVGRDIQDRLKWQYDLYHALCSDIPLAEVFDYFYENGDSYLTMEYVKGSSLTKWMYTIYRNRTWLDLSRTSQLLLINTFSKVIEIIQRLHEKGYIHRDITPENFIITKQGDIFLIDLELVCSSSSKLPDPPFRWGTPGFMSPEQSEAQLPTIKEDIYALGAFMLMFFTNYLPTKFSAQPHDHLKTNILFLTGSELLGQLLPDCLDNNPLKRPSLSIIKRSLNQLKEQLLQNSSIECLKVTYGDSNLQDIRKVIQAGIIGLTNSRLSPDHNWISKLNKENPGGIGQAVLTIYEGWHTGVAGPLWLLAKAKRSGFLIDKCKPSYLNSWKYIIDNVFKKPLNFPAGLYMGTAGIALALTECLNSSIITPNTENLDLLDKCFYYQESNLSLSTGVAGQGIALLHSAPWLAKKRVNDLLNSYISRLVKEQQRDGSWKSLSASENKNDISTGMDNGISGIIWFLLGYMQYNPEIEVKETIVRSLKWLIKNMHKQGNRCNWALSVKSHLKDKWSCDKGIPGIALMFIKAYEVLKDPSYQRIAENSLEGIPARPSLMNFTMGSGLSGLGEIYLEAFKVFGNIQWQERAQWIAQLFCVTFISKDETGGYWITDETNVTTADLFSGNSGIIHFLIRYLFPGKLNHPLS
jgi:hypothetical protein